MSDDRRKSHEDTVYERPAERFRCGRAAMWRKPCWQGPDAKGACQGRAECAPMRDGDRWECKRPKFAGGKCTEGPLPDGTCSHTQPPCTPRRSLRGWRGRAVALSLLALLVVFFAGINPTARSVVNPVALDAGDLASSHAGFTRARGCEACHAAHRSDALGWLVAAFGNNNPSAQCMECHDFAGPAARVHNASFPKRPEIQTISCTACHTEHKGAKAHLAQVADYVCANCHQKTFDNFAASHPAFDERYPYNHPGRIYFDHARHMSKHFADPKVLARSKTVAEFATAARGKCTACHAVEGAAREVSPLPYEKICGTCHDRDITSGELTVLEPSQMTYAGSVLLGIEKDGDEKISGKRLGDLWQAMARSGDAALVEAIGEDATRRKRAAALFTGLSPSVARDVGTAWSAKRAASAGGKAGTPGWAARENAEGRPALVYTPAAHADPVLKAWIEQAAVDARSADKARAPVASEALEQLIDKDAAGACGKCHGAALRAAAPEEAGRAWKRAGREVTPYSRFSHGPHLELVDPEGGCRICHDMNPESAYAKYFTARAGKPQPYQSNFSGIRKEACVECHQPGQVNSACQTCHAYHLKHQFKLGFRTRGAPKNEPSAR